MTEQERIEKYASQMSTQMRKGFIAFCVLKVCSKKPVYTSDIIKELRDAKLVVVEGTIYPLLSRLQKEGLLSHEWQESEQGPPRKYYKITDFGEQVMKTVGEEISNLNSTINKL
ncbi:MAG: PadR family transcriptional regulator [Candidatus Nanogingivalis sp.]|jgi:PadR family transcriptional regulator PadR